MQTDRNRTLTALTILQWVIRLIARAFPPKPMLDVSLTMTSMAWLVHRPDRAEPGTFA
jgi:hypothetical protein